MKIAIAAFLSAPIALLTPAAASAQVYDLPTLAQSQVISSTAKNQARRSAARSSGGATADQVDACAGLPRYRREYGADNSKVRQLERLCRNAGL